MHWVIAHFSLITIRIYCILSAIIVFYFAEIYIAYRNAIFCNGTLDPDLKPLKTRKTEQRKRCDANESNDAS